ncbi:MAG TPA: DUF6569 family protein [Acidobacteriaceae bacterium]|nr:DUF6569 family protein [Acidobacteriaceae bacterium]
MKVRPECASRKGSQGWWKGGLGFSLAAGLVCLGIAGPSLAGTGNEAAYRVLPAIRRGNLAIFPVLGGKSYNTSQLLTLDEGIRTGAVVVTEAGNDAGLVRGEHPQPYRGAEVNRLVLYNNSARPLLLLAGEIVTGGKQDRVIGADRIVPPKGGPMDLSVFCVEPGRWVASSAKFGSMAAQMAQPSVRMPAMAEQNQMSVWDHVRASNAAMANLMPAPEAHGAIAGTSSYAKVFASPPVEAKLEQYGGHAGEAAILAELRSRGAVGVVVAVNGNVEWADVFASTDLLAQYWPKLMRSYVAEAMTSPGSGETAELSEAQSFIARLSGGREVAETEPGVFRRTETTGDGYKVFTLRGLTPETDFEVHMTKMTD